MKYKKPLMNVTTKKGTITERISLEGNTPNDIAVFITYDDDWKSEKPLLLEDYNGCKYWTLYDHPELLSRAVQILFNKPSFRTYLKAEMQTFEREAQSLYSQELEDQRLSKERYDDLLSFLKAYFQDVEQTNPNKLIDAAQHIQRIYEG